VYTFAWFVTFALGFVLYWLLSRRTAVGAVYDRACRKAV